MWWGRLILYCTQPALSEPAAGYTGGAVRRLKYPLTGRGWSISGAGMAQRRSAADAPGSGLAVGARGSPESGGRCWDGPAAVGGGFRLGAAFQTQSGHDACPDAVQRPSLLTLPLQRQPLSKARRRRR